MTGRVKTLTLAAAALATGVTGLFWSGDITLGRGSGLITEAQAIIGRPLTPMSYAGVARRTVRRGVYAGAAVGAYGAYGYARGPACGYYPTRPVTSRGPNRLPSKTRRCGWSLSVERSLPHSHSVAAASLRATSTIKGVDTSDRDLPLCPWG